MTSGEIWYNGTQERRNAGTQEAGSRKQKANFVIRLFRLIVDPEYRFKTFNDRGFYDNISDKKFVSKHYKARTGKKLNLKNPVTLNEKLQWLKLYNKNPKITIMADKYEAKKYVASKIGEEFVIPCYNAWLSADEIDLKSLPQQFVLKCNHNSGGGMFICKNKSELDTEKFNAVKAKLQKNLDEDYFKYSREWSYKNINRKIICEKFIENADKSPLEDYKFYCYGEEPRYFMYSLGEANSKTGIEGHAINHKFNMQCESIDYLFKKQPAIKLEDIKLPENINEMIDIAKILCKGFQHIRVDLYNVDGKIYFGEFTFYSGGGFINMENQEYSQYLADLIDLDKIRSGETC